MIGLRALLTLFFEIKAPTYEQFAAADVNGDGALTVSDLIGIINIILGIGWICCIANNAGVLRRWLEYWDVGVMKLGKANYNQRMNVIGDQYRLGKEIATEYAGMPSRDVAGLVAQFVSCYRHD